MGVHFTRVGTISLSRTPTANGRVPATDIEY